MTNKTNRVLYTGITNDLKRRVYEHKAKLVEGFTQKYNVNRLLYYEASREVESAIVREKQIKGGSRGKKTRLVETTTRNGKICTTNYEIASPSARNDNSRMRYF